MKRLPLRSTPSDPDVLEIFQKENNHTKEKKKEIIEIPYENFFFACPPNVPLTAHSIYIIFWTRLGDFLFSKTFPTK